MANQVDHLVVAAASLDDGVRWCESTLGVTPGAGGRHPLMGTHNRLLALSDAAHPLCYLEIIAIDPDVPPPGRVRWFGLDDPALQARLRGDGPQLVHSVVRTTQLEMQRWGLVALGFAVGEPVAAGRETAQGPLRWRILVRDDGTLLAAGALPTLIEWQGRHPAAAMPPSGVTLAALALRGLPPPVCQLLRLRGVRCEADGSGIEATLQTPRGPVNLRSPTPA